MQSDQGRRVAEEEKRYYSLVKRAFGTLAPVYDIFVTPMAGLRDRVVSFADAKPGSRILDVGTGTGKQAFAFAKLGYDVVGVDLSDAMLKVASKKNRYKNATFSMADAANLPFADAGFDVSCTSFVIHTMPSTIRERVLKEMVRVTRPGGMVLIVDFGLPQNRLHRLLDYSLIYGVFSLFHGHRYYAEFVKSDLKALLGKLGVETEKELPVLLGSGRVLKGVKRASRPVGEAGRQQGN